MNDAVTAVIGGTQLFQRLLKRLEEHLSVLPDKPDESPWNTLVCLWSMATGQAIALSQIGEPLSPLDHAGAERLENLVEQRLAGTPLAHLTGRQDFMNLVLLASPAALVPRRETEVIGYASLEKARKVPAERPLVVDLCTGAGNLALAIAKHCPRARVYGSDLSPEAVSLARENARFVGCNEVEFRCGDLLEPFKEPAFIGAVDVLICNPPYISTARVATMPMEISRHEPRLAFDGGPFGVNLLRRLIAGAPLLLKPGGSLLFEVGHGQGDHAAKLVEREQTLSQVERLRDSNGIVRVIAAARTIRLGSEHA